MDTKERIIFNKKGKDIGLRENAKGAIYIKPKLYFQNDRIRKLIEKFSHSEIVTKSK